jgi:hypothetical protein
LNIIAIEAIKTLRAGIISTRPTPLVVVVMKLVNVLQSLVKQHIPFNTLISVSATPTAVAAASHVAAHP